MITYTNTPNANMADHSVGARDESNGSEASEALMFSFENASPENSCFVVDLIRFISLCLRVAVFLNATRRDRNPPPFTSNLLFVYKSLNGLCPQYLTNLLEHRKSARSLRSNFQDLLIQPTCKTKTYGDRAFSVCAPKIWNTVPLEIRQSSTVVLFKKKLKTFLFTRFIESNSLSYF